MARFSQGRIEALVAGARRFAALQPGVLTAAGYSPGNASLERVRRGVLALAASVLDRMTDFDADSHRALAEVVAPSLMRPLPSATIVELSSSTGPLWHVPAGAEMTSARDPWCRFRLVSPVDVGPYAVENAQARGRSLDFDLVATGDVPLEEAMGGELRLYVDGPLPRALLLVMHVLDHTERVELHIPDHGIRPLGPVAPYGLEPESMLAPEPDGPPMAGALLQEYFAFREKFAFLVLRPPSGAFSGVLRGTHARRATVTLRFKEPLPSGISLGADGLRARCVPAVNLFRATAEPQTFGPGRTSFPVRVAGMPRAHAEVYAVLSATATPRDRAGPEIPLPPVRRFAAERFSRDFPYAYSTRRVLPRMPAVPAVQAVHADPDMILTLTSPREAPPLLEPHVISLSLLATNRARRLAPGDLNQPGTGMPPSLRARNLSPTSSYIPASHGADLALRAFMRGSISNGDPLFALQSFLFALAPSDQVDPARSRSHAARIHALSALAIAPAEGGGGSRRGYMASLTLDETPFDGLGDVALFLRLLHAALDAHVAVNAFYRCEAHCTKTGERLAWPPARKVPAVHEHPCTATGTGRAHDALHAPESGFRAGSASLLRRLVESAPRYGFFEAARLLEHALSRGEHKSNGARRRLRFGQDVSLSFPTGDVASLTVSGESGRLGLRFLGLVGTASPLAAAWTEHVIQEDDEGTLRAFYDVIHDAFAVRLFDTWKARAIEGGFDLRGEDSLSRILRSLAGIDAFTTLDDDPLPPMMALGLADFQRGAPHTIDLRTAEQLLQRLLPWPISLEPNVPQTVAVSPSDRAHLGGSCSTLGDDFVYGEQRNDSECIVRLHVGPVDRATYATLMPGAPAYTELERLTRRIFDGKITVELEIHLGVDDAPQWQLGNRSKLGADTYYTAQRGEALHARVLLLTDPDDARLHFVSTPDPTDAAGAADAADEKKSC